jgi:SAM-dependent methyltransferase
MLSQRSLFTEHASTPLASQYRLLPSVWPGEDAELLELMLDFYPRTPPQRILDATVNGGRFWRGRQQPVTGLDINPRYRPDVVGDNLYMPFRASDFDVVVYDPPHIPNQGKDRSKDFNTCFGLVLKSSAAQGYNFSHLYLPFVREAYRLLQPEGILLDFCSAINDAKKALRRVRPERSMGSVQTTPRHLTGFSRIKFLRSFGKRAYRSAS